MAFRAFVRAVFEVSPPGTLNSPASLKGEQHLCGVALFPFILSPFTSIHLFLSCFAHNTSCQYFAVFRSPVLCLNCCISHISCPVLFLHFFPLFVFPISIHRLPSLFTVLETLIPPVPSTSFHHPSGLTFPFPTYNFHLAASHCVSCLLSCSLSLLLPLTEPL